MKMRKLAALSMAAMMAMGISANAAVTGTATASYVDGEVILSSLADIDATNQWTVIVIAEEDQNKASLTADDLYYINQGTSGEAFWTDGMGTKTTLADGNYIIRIGGETITDASKVIEIELTVSTAGTTPTYTLGDVNADDSINMSDAAAVLNHFTGDAVLTDETALLSADVNADDSINMSDAAAILNHFTGDAPIK